MAQTQLPRGRNAKAPRLQVSELLPEKVRIQAFAYNRRTRQYHALSASNVKVIVRNEHELARLWKAIEAVVQNPAGWQD